MIVITPRVPPQFLDCLILLHWFCYIHIHYYDSIFCLYLCSAVFREKDLTILTGLTLSSWFPTSSVPFYCQPDIPYYPSIFTLVDIYFTSCTFLWNPCHPQSSLIISLPFLLRGWSKQTTSTSSHHHIYHLHSLDPSAFILCMNCELRNTPSTPSCLLWGIASYYKFFPFLCHLHNCISAHTQFFLPP